MVFTLCQILAAAQLALTCARLVSTLPTAKPASPMLCCRLAPVYVLKGLCYLKGNARPVDRAVPSAKWAAASAFLGTFSSLGVAHGLAPGIIKRMK